MDKNYYYCKNIIKILFLFCLACTTANANSLKELYFNHQGNASDKWMNYFDIYEDNFSKFVNKKPDILEIGLQNGGSSQIFSKYKEKPQFYKAFSLNL